MAATAARASLLTPQATIGTAMRSASSRSTRSRMSQATSTISRSAPRPERSTLSACSIESAWVTLAPLAIAILVAVVSCPLRLPTIRRRMVVSFQSHSRRVASIPFRLNDFGHCHAELLFDQHHLAAGHEAVVDIDVDGLADLAIVLEHRARPQLEQLADFHAGAPEYR